MFFWNTPFLFYNALPTLMPTEENTREQPSAITMGSRPLVNHTPAKLKHPLTTYNKSQVPTTGTLKG
jgi:hypothetical protein